MNRFHDSSPTVSLVKIFTKRIVALQNGTPGLWQNSKAEASANAGVDARGQNRFRVGISRLQFEIELEAAKLKERVGNLPVQHRDYRLGLTIQFGLKHFEV